MTGVHAVREQRREFWLLIAAGVASEDSAERVGFERQTGNRWFREAGGMAPFDLDEPARRRTMNIAEREQILAGISADKSIRAIARELGRAPSTIQRELRKNLHSQDYAARHRSTSRRRGDWTYSPHLAQLRAERALARPKTAKLATNDRLRGVVQDRLELNHSPEQIAHRLLVDFPNEESMRVSHETIYRSIYVQGRGALRRDLARCLRTGRALRKPRRRVQQRRPRLINLVSIADRPAEVEDRAVPGHWEGDLIVGKDSASAIGTLVERATGFTLLLHLPDNHGALAVQEAMVAAMAELPDTLRRTLTWDQGIEMANHATIADQTGLDIYFCDPHSPWQRGTNENTNGLLRQYFPKGTDLSRWGPGFLDKVASELNTRPRKRLNWKTPAEALDQLLSQQDMLR